MDNELTWECPCCKGAGKFDLNKISLKDVLELARKTGLQIKAEFIDTLPPSSEDNTVIVREEQTDGWRDIASAPRDGTSFIVWNDKAHKHRVRVVYFDPRYPNMKGFYDGNGNFVGTATHWQPLPAPPSGNEGKEGG